MVVHVGIKKVLVKPFLLNAGVEVNFRLISPVTVRKSCMCQTENPN